MKIIEDILETVKTGKVPQPFSAADLARALRDRLWSRGSFATLLARHSADAKGGPALFVRVDRGRYRLAAGPVPTRSKRRPSRRRGPSAGKSIGPH